MGSFCIYMGATAENLCLKQQISGGPITHLDCQPLELTHIEMMEESLRVEQLLMSALFHDLAIINDDDVVCIPDRG